MVQKYTSNNKEYFLTKDIENNNENIFTIVVGKNGIGKSYMLNRIVHECAKIPNEDDIWKRNYFFNPEAIVELDNKPAKIIAVSTSPFDRFPVGKEIPSKNFSLKDYAYLGIRDLRGNDYGLAFMTKIILILIEVTFLEREKIKYLSNVLSYLGYSDIIEIVFKSKLSETKSRNLLRAARGKKFDEVERILDKHLNSNKSSYSTKRINFSDSIIREICEILSSKRNRFNLDYKILISNNKNRNELNLEQFNLLTELGIIKLDNVQLLKKSTRIPVTLKDASSGEQCIILSILGIACFMEDNSVICIDEPEISLHPKWQEAYIMLLMDTFKDYKQCHFIIATHSPQIVSRLRAKNCFVLTMDNSRIIEASDFINQSIDFQLAHIFDSPGFKNEYLTRLAFSIISRVAENKRFNRIDYEQYNIINSQIQFMDKNDPTIKLFEIVTDLKTKYV